MKNIITFISVIMTCFSLPAFSASETPDLSGFWGISYQAEQSDAAQSLLDKLPANAVFIDDGGSSELGEGDFSGLTLTQKALDEIKEYDPKDELSLESSCVRPSVAFYMQAPFPFEIHQGRDMIVFMIEYYDMYRVVFMDGRDHPPADAPHSKSGHSIGHWEGDELVVDTTHLSPASFMNNGFNNSDDLHMVERFKLSADGSSLWSTETFEDPAVFAGIGTRFVAWNKVPNEYIFPYECKADFMEISGTGE